MDFSTHTVRISESLGPTAMIVTALVTAELFRRVWPLDRMKTSAAADGAAVVPSDDRARYDVFDGLRGLLCLCVFVHHADITLTLGRLDSDWIKKSADAPSFLLPRDLSTGLFFAMTAFLFYARACERPRPLDVVDFWRKRAWRLGPALLVSAALMFAVELLPTSPHLMSPWVAAKLLLKSLTLGAVGPSWFDQNLGVWWTLSYEWIFYLAFPLLAAAVVGGAPAWVRVVGAIACLSVAGESIGRMTIAMTYASGIAAAHAHTHPLVRRVARGALGSSIAVLLCAGLTLASNHLDARRTIPLVVATAAGVMTLMAAGCDLFGLLRMPALRAIGTASYSVYLFHGIALYALRFAIIPHRGDAVASYGILCGIVVAVVVASMISYTHIERPGIERGRRKRRSAGGGDRLIDTLRRPETPRRPTVAEAVRVG